MRLVVSKMLLDFPVTNIYSFFIKTKFEMYFFFYQKMLSYYYSYFFYCSKAFQSSIAKRPIFLQLKHLKKKKKKLKRKLEKIIKSKFTNQFRNHLKAKKLNKKKYPLLKKKRVKNYLSSSIKKKKKKRHKNRVSLAVYKKNMEFKRRRLRFQIRRLLKRKKRKLFWKKRKFKRRRKLYFFHCLKVHQKKNKIHKKYNFFLYKGGSFNTFDLRGYFSKDHGYEWIPFYFGGLASFFYKSKPILPHMRYFKRLKRTDNVLKKSKLNPYSFTLDTKANLSLLLYLSRLDNQASVVRYRDKAISIFLPEDKDFIYNMYSHRLSKNSIFLENVELPHSFFNLYNHRTRIHWN